MKRKFRYRRTAEIKITNEARVLRQLRLSAGLSIREVGRRLGKSETYIRHIENGRMDVPKRYLLEPILSVYGASWKIYIAKSRMQVDLDPYLELKSIISNIPEEKVPLILTLVRGVLSS